MPLEPYRKSPAFALSTWVKPIMMNGLNRRGPRWRRIPVITGLARLTPGGYDGIFVKTHVLAHSSIMEGGANVISEAVIAGVPIIASEIDGNVGLLGEDYPGYYPVKDTGALRALLLQAETDRSFLQRLGKHGAKRKYLFTPGREAKTWKNLLDSL